jgi:hypothetical protein
MKFSFAAVAVIALAGCIQSTAPLESDAAKPSEPTLLGHWKSDLDGDPMVATIRQAKNGDLEADVLANWEPGPKAATKRMQIVLARIGDARYMSIRDLELSPAYYLARYELVGKDHFRLYGMYTEELLDAMKQKRVAGEFREDRHMSTVSLTADSAELRAYFRDHGAKAISDEGYMEFERVESAKLPPPQKPGAPKD